MKFYRQWSLSLALFLAISSSQAIMIRQQQKVNVQVQSKVDAEASTDQQSQAKVETTAATSTASSDYNTDALDELLEGSLFKKKKTDGPVSEDTLVDSVLKSKVDMSQFGLDIPAAPAAAPEQAPVETENVQVSEATQSSKDMSLIQNSLSKFTGTTQPEVGSSILYGAINDLDLGEAKIPEFQVPGMPSTGPQNALYATAMDPASPWALTNGAATPPSTVDVTQLSSETLDGQTPTRLSAESYMRGGNKYEEQAEDLLDNQEKELKDNVQVQLAIQQAAAAKQAEATETEDMLSTAFSSMKSTAKKNTDVVGQINAQEDLAYLVAFGS